MGLARMLLSLILMLAGTSCQRTVPRDLAVATVEHLGGHPGYKLVVHQSGVVDWSGAEGVATMGIATRRVPALQVEGLTSALADSGFLNTELSPLCRCPDPRSLDFEVPCVRTTVSIRGSERTITRRDVACDEPSAALVAKIERLVETAAEVREWIGPAPASSTAVFHDVKGDEFCLKARVALEANGLTVASWYGHLFGLGTDEQGRPLELEVGLAGSDDVRDALTGTAPDGYFLSTEAGGNLVMLSAPGYLDVYVLVGAGEHCVEVRLRPDPAHRTVRAYPSGAELPLEQFRRGR